MRINNSKCKIQNLPFGKDVILHFEFALLVLNSEFLVSHSELCILSYAF